MEKVINKAKLDDFIGMIKEYWFNTTDIDEIKKLCEIYYKFAKDNFGSIASELSSLMGAIFPTTSGLKPDATNEDIYKVLEVLGWEVKE